MAIKSTGLSTAGLKSEFFATFEDTAAHYPDLSTLVKSQLPTEQYKFLHELPRMREFGTGRLAKGLGTESYDVENKKYEVTMEVDRDEIDDDQTGQIKMRVHGLAEACRTFPDWLLAQLLINGGASGYVAYDGKTFFANDHESGSSGAQDNDLAPSATDANNPTVAELKTSLRTAIETMMAFKTDAGTSARLAPSGLILVCPPSQYFGWLEVVNSTVISSTSNTMEGVARVLQLPDISTATTWYLLKTDLRLRPFIFQERAVLEFNSLAEGSEEEFKREKHFYGCRWRFAVAYARWELAIRNVFA